MSGNYIIKSFRGWQPAASLEDALNAAHAMLRDIILEEQHQGKWWTTIDSPDYHYTLTMKRDDHGRYHGAGKEVLL